MSIPDMERCVGMAVVSLWEAQKRSLFFSFSYV